MNESRTITLGGQDFAIPHLPLGVSMEVYPECRELTTAGLPDRIAAAGGVMDCTKEEFAKLAELSFLVVKSVKPEMTRDEFMALPVTPVELANAFFTIRIQTGGWVAATPGAPAPEGDQASGEAQGADPHP